MKYKVSFNARWYANVDYDTVRNCDRAGCDSICRCGELVNLRVVSVDLSGGMIDIKHPHETKRGVSWRDYKCSTIESYCIDRLLRIHKAYDSTLYTAYSTRGYYGEEVGGVEFANTPALVADVTTMLSYSTDIEKVKFVLEREYTYILPLISKTTNVAIVSLKPIDLELNTDYMTRLKRESQAKYELMGALPVGVVFNDPNVGSRLIDGYHRLSSLTPKAKYNFIVLS